MDRGSPAWGKHPMSRANFFVLYCRGMKERTNPRDEEADGAPVQGQTGQPLRILVVDDEPGIRRLNATVLSRSGYEVSAAADGADAWQALNTDGYDLLITDQNLPKVSGVELIKKLRGARMAVPVIMATGTFPREELNRHPWLQPDATLLKPYTIEALLGTVKEVLLTTGGRRERTAAPRSGPGLARENNGR